MAILGWIRLRSRGGHHREALDAGPRPGGFIVTILLGIAGALVGGFLGRAVGWYREGDPVGFVMAVIGSIVLLILYRLAVRGARRA